MLGFTGFLGLTRISQIPRYCFVGGKSHRWFCVWAVGLARIPLCFWAHTDLTDSTVLLCGWEISQMFCVWAGSHGFHFAFGLTRISQIPQYRFVGGKSHRCFCVWAGSRGSHFAFGLTQISQIPRYRFVGGKSHRWFCAWVALLAQNHWLVQSGI